MRSYSRFAAAALAAATLAACGQSRAPEPEPQTAPASGVVSIRPGEVALLCDAINAPTILTATEPDATGNVVMLDPLGIHFVAGAWLDAIQGRATCLDIELRPILAELESEHIDHFIPYSTEMRERTLKSSCSEDRNYDLLEFEVHILPLLRPG